MLFLKNDSYIYCTTIKVETPYSGKRKCPPENQTDIFIKSSYDPSDEHRKEQQKLPHAEQDETNRTKYTTTKNICGENETRTAAQRDRERWSLCGCSYKQFDFYFLFSPGFCKIVKIVGF